MKIQQEGIRQLPVEIDDAYIYQEAQLLIIESAKGFTIQCNLKFDVCTITLVGEFNNTFYITVKTYVKKKERK